MFRYSCLSGCFFFNYRAFPPSPFCIHLNVGHLRSPHMLHVSCYMLTPPSLHGYFSFCNGKTLWLSSIPSFVRRNYFFSPLILFILFIFFIPLLTLPPTHPSSQPPRRHPSSLFYGNVFYRIVHYYITFHNKDFLFIYFLAVF